MKNVMLSLMLGVTTTQAALLTPYFGPGSEGASYGDWSGTDISIGLCSTGDCVTGDAGMESFFSPPWDGVATVAANASASTSPGAVYMEAHAFADALIYCHDESCDGLAPYGFLMQGSATLTLNILVDTPASGWVVFDTFTGGVPTGTASVPTSGGPVQIALVSHTAYVQIFLAEIGSVSAQDHRSYEIRNVQWVPEPNSLWLVGAALAGLPFTRVRRRRH